MISLSSEITDSKGARARSGWLFFDADCAFCTRIAARLRPLLATRGFGLATLQDPRVQDMLGLPPEELLRELRLLLPDGTLLGGADAILHLTEKIWWTKPLTMLAKLPGVRPFLRAAYRWVAARRHCLSASRAHSCVQYCEIQKGGG